MRIMITLLLLSVVFISACAEKHTYEEMVSCSSDADCVAVKGRGCCVCDTVINKEYVDYWNTREVDSCPGRECEMCPKTPDRAGCVNNICKGIYVENGG